MEIGILFAGIPVATIAPATRWYERLLGRPADIVVTATEVMWRFSESAWLYIVEDHERAGQSLVTLHVSDLSRTVSEVEARGMSKAHIKAVGPTGHKAEYTDPDGNKISLIEVPADSG